MGTSCQALGAEAMTQRARENDRKCLPRERHHGREPIVWFQGFKRLGGVEGGQGLGWAHVGSRHSSPGFNCCCSCLRGQCGLPAICSVPKGLSLTACNGGTRLLQPGKQGLMDQFLPLSLNSSSSAAPALCLPPEGLCALPSDLPRLLSVQR